MDLLTAGRREVSAEEADCGEEAAFADDQGQVDGVEVPAAPKAAGEVGVGVGGGMEVTANWAKETKITITCFRRDPQHRRDQAAYIDLISEAPEVIVGDSRCHLGSTSATC